MILALFCIWEDVRVWAYLNYSFNTCPNYLGPISSFPPSRFPSGSTVQGVCGGLMALRLKYPMFITNSKSTYENTTLTDDIIVLETPVVYITLRKTS